MKGKSMIALAAGLGMAAVGLGAFGAHGLRTIVSPEQVATFTTGVRYQFYHVFAIALTGLLSFTGAFSLRRLSRAVWCWTVGLLLFSGSIYLLSLRDVHGLAVGFLGPITPIGGLLLIAGWAFLLASALTAENVATKTAKRSSGRDHV